MGDLGKPDSLSLNTLWLGAKQYWDKEHTDHSLYGWCLCQMAMNFSENGKDKVVAMNNFCIIDMQEHQVTKFAEKYQKPDMI